MSLNQITSPTQYNPTVKFREIETGSITTTNFSTDKIGLGDGTVSTPSLYFQDDTNTGIFSSLNDTLNITTGGSQTALFNNAFSGIKLPLTMVDSFTSPTTNVNYINDNFNSGLIQTGNAGSYYSLTYPFGNSNFKIRLKTDGTNGNTVSIDSDLTFFDTTYSEKYFQIDKIGKGVKFPVNSNSPTLYSPSTLHIYEELTLTPTYSNISNLTQGDGSIKITRIGNNITLSFNALIGTTPGGPTSCPLLSAGTIPARFQPLNSIHMPCIVLDNNIYRTGSFMIQVGGAFVLNHDETPYSTFGNHANTGMLAFSVSYSV